jgi:hypothetical protein
LYKNVIEKHRIQKEIPTIHGCINKSSSSTRA